MRQQLAELAKYRYPFLVAVALTLLAVVGYYVNQPLQAAKAELEGKLKERRRAVAELQSLLSRRPQFEARLKEIDGALTALKGQLVQGRQQPSFLTYLEDSASDSGVVVVSLSFDNPQAVESATAKPPASTAQGAAAKPPASTAQGATAKPPASTAQGATAKAAPAQGTSQGTSQGANQGTGAAAAGTPPQSTQKASTSVLRYPVALKVLGSYPGVVDFVGRMERVAPFVNIDDINVVAASTPAGAAAASKDKPAIKPVSLPDGWVNLDIHISVLAEADGSSEWARELSELVRGLGRLNPFERPNIVLPKPPAAGNP